MKRKLYEEFETTPSASGGTIDNYVNTGVILKSDFWKVYRATQNERSVVVKWFFRRKEEAMFQFEQEHKALSMLQHDNIVRLLHVELKPEAFFVMEDMYGDLRHVLAVHYPKGMHGQIDVVASLLQQLLWALKFCHSLGVRHRDVKPDNLLVCPQDGRAKLADFGLSWWDGGTEQSNLDRDDCNVVTHWYRPPELLLELTPYDDGVDIWPVGCMLFEMWTKEVLFHGSRDSISVQLSAILKRRGPPMNTEWDLSEAARVIIKFHAPLPPVTLPSGWTRANGSPWTTDAGVLHLAEGLLAYDPAKRLTAADALCNRVFDNVRNCDPTPLLPVRPAV